MRLAVPNAASLYGLHVHVRATQAEAAAFAEQLTKKGRCVLLVKDSVPP
jgi:hypothetical protein